MASWGSQAVELHFPFTTILQSMLITVDINEEIIWYEILLSISSLINGYGSKLRAEWDCLYEIFKKLYDNIIISNSPALNTLSNLIRDCLTNISNLYSTNQFFGSYDTYFELLEIYKQVRSESSSLSLLHYRSDLIFPWNSGWINNANAFFKSFYFNTDAFNHNEIPPQIRHSSLKIMKNLVTTCSSIYENVVVNIILTYLSDLADEIDNELIMSGLDLVSFVAIAINSDFEEFIKIVNIIHEVGWEANNENLAILSFNYLVKIFEHRFNHVPSKHSSHILLLIFTFIASPFRLARKVT